MVGVVGLCNNAMPPMPMPLAESPTGMEESSTGAEDSSTGPESDSSTAAAESLTGMEDSSSTGSVTSVPADASLQLRLLFNADITVLRLVVDSRAQLVGGTSSSAARSAIVQRTHHLVRKAVAV